MNKNLNKIKNQLVTLFSNINFQIIFIILFSCIVILIFYITEAYTKFDYISYDAFMKFIKKPIKEDDSLVLLDIDDNTMNSDFIKYSWPFPRYLYGDVVEVAADFGTKAIVFDIEFMGKSVAGVNIDEANETLNLIEEKVKNIKEDFYNISIMIAQNKNFQKDLTPIIQSYNSNLDSYLKEIKNKYHKIIEDNDQYFSKRLKYFGKAYGTVNMLYDKSVIFDEKAKRENERALKYLKIFGYEKTKFPNYKKIKLRNNNIAEFPNDIILNSFRKVGFTKVELDRDASTRRITLFREKDGYIIPQLSLSPFLDIFDISQDRIDLSNKDKIIFRKVNINNKVKDIVIPLDEKGMMRINWPKGQFIEIFAINKEEVKNNKAHPNHLSFAKLIYYKQVLLKNFSYNLTNFLYLNDDVAKSLYTEYHNFLQYKESMVENSTVNDQYIKDLNDFLDDYFKRVKDFTSLENLNLRIEEIDNIIKNSNLSNEDKNQLESIKESISLVFNEIRKNTELIIDFRKQLKKELYNKICFMGLTATGTTDFGATPFDSDFENVGTHPSIFNTILQQDFIRISPFFLVFLFCLIIYSFLISMLIKKNAIISASIGLLSTFIIIIIIGFIYHYTNYYITPVIPFIYGIVSFILMIIIKFILTEKDKSFLKSTFSSYLSPELIEEMFQKKTMPKLGGESKIITAYFTDIQNFSTFSEKLTATQLVELLNEYLSAMTTILLENKGTLDKYEGDAIVAFIGAPMTVLDHTYRACLIAINMQNKLLELRKKWVSEKQSPDEPDRNTKKLPEEEWAKGDKWPKIVHNMKMRIGINTGEIVIGNMGSEIRMNYTMMGDSVNLAARLEAGAKQYGVYTLVSEFTLFHKFTDEKGNIVKTNDLFEYRFIDKIIVVGKSEPVRVYELVCEKGKLTDKEKELFNLYSFGIDAYLKRQWDKAEDYFKEALKFERFPEGKTTPSEVYIKRCKHFKQNPPPENWDGTWVLTEK